jgi:hypothetical protein
MRTELANAIEQIGEGLVACDRSCQGIVCSRATGQIPRCLFLDADDRQGARGAAVVGLNPGATTTTERAHYLTHRCSYQSVMNWFFEAGLSHRYGRNHRYYKRLRKLVDALGLNGPILWTELVKCETDPNFNGPPLQTFRTCTGEFLQRELGQLPDGWPLFGVGREAYKWLAYQFTKRTVIGVPHPTGSYGQFCGPFGLFENDSLCEAVASEVRTALSGKGQALWLKNPRSNFNGHS